MGSDDGTIVVLLLKIGYGLFQQGIARPTTVVSCDEFEVSLALDRLEGAEEDCGAESVFDETQRPAREDSLDADRAEFVTGVVPHGFVTAFEDVGGAETGL